MSHDEKPHEPALQALLYRMARRDEAYRLLRIARERELGRKARRH